MADKYKFPEPISLEDSLKGLEEDSIYKYRLIKTDFVFYGKPVYRIQALKDFSDVKKGDLGGYVQSYHNLSQEGNCWISDNSLVLDNAIVENDGRVEGNSIVRGNAKVQEYGEATGRSIVEGNAVIRGLSEVTDYTEISGDVVIEGNVIVKGYPIIRGDAVIASPKDYIVFENNFSNIRFFTYTFSNKMWTVGYFYGNSEELLKQAYEESKFKGKMYSIYVELVEKMEKVRNENENEIC